MESTFEWCGYHWTDKMGGYRKMNSSAPWRWYSAENIVLNTNNELELYIKYNPKEIKHDGVIYHPVYEVPTMSTIEDFDFGTFSAEIKVTKGLYLSSSFWLTGSGNWPPEIDIEEGWSNNNRWFRLGENYPPYLKPSWRTTTNVHYRDEQMNKTHIGSRNISICKQPKNPSENFIKYECEWLPDKIIFKANGKVVRTIKDDVCRKLIENISKPEKGYRMCVMFNVWCENPDLHEIAQYTPMIIRNFKYEPYAINK